MEEKASDERVLANMAGAEGQYSQLSVIPNRAHPKLNGREIFCDCSHTVGDLDKALGHYTTAVLSNPKSAALYAKRARYLQALKYYRLLFYTLRHLHTHAYLYTTTCAHATHTHHMHLYIPARALTYHMYLYIPARALIYHMYPLIHTICTHTCTHVRTHTHT